MTCWAATGRYWRNILWIYVQYSTVHSLDPRGFIEGRIRARAETLRPLEIVDTIVGGDGQALEALKELETCMEGCGDLLKADTTGRRAVVGWLWEVVVGAYGVSGGHRCFQREGLERRN